MRDTKALRNLCKCYTCKHKNVEQFLKPCSRCFFIPIGNSEFIGIGWQRRSNNNQVLNTDFGVCEIPMQEHTAQLEFEIAELRERLDDLIQRIMEKRI